MERTIPQILRRSSSLARSAALASEVSASSIRKSFLDFFCLENNHFHIRSSPVFSLLDPTLAFVNAGMNQFKRVFLDFDQSAFKRVANSQKCIRVGGKHNDLAQVGLDDSHHTFFEMLGNWSFGDYFKKEACVMSWDLLTKVYRLPPEKLYVTYFGGDKALGVDADLEVREVWREIGVEESHILPFGPKDNFWEMSSTGPCGVCTEIHYDHVPERKDAGNLVNSGRDDLTELWNLVFLQYNRLPNGKLENLNRNFVDTGMGFERLTAVLQGKRSNYETDLFVPLFEAIKNHTGRQDFALTDNSDPVTRSFKILADHSRMITVALSDGMLPNHQNKVRTVIRKALSICEQAFNSDFRLLNEVTNRVAETLSDAYPELGRNLRKIHHVIESEDEILKNLQKQAKKQLKKGQAILPNLEVTDLMETPKLVSSLEFVKKEVLDRKQNAISSENAWFLFDTYGVSPKATQKIASDLGLKFNMASFEQYEAAIKKKKIKDLENLTPFQGSGRVKPEVVDKLFKLNLKKTSDRFKYDYRLSGSDSYIFNKQPTTIKAIIVDDDVVESVTAEDVEGKVVGLVLDRTQFTNEERNSESDSGNLLIENEIVFEIDKVVKVKGFSIHFGTFKYFPRDTSVAVNYLGILELNEERRLQLMRNHTALNLLKGIFREKISLVGEKNSMVTPDSLSVDFMLFKDKLELKDLEDIEKSVRNIIRHGVSVRIRNLTLEQFYDLEDVAAFPGTNPLGAEVFVFDVNSGFTVIRELCSGVHVLQTSDLQDFVITSFKNKGYFVKRIEAVTGDKAVSIRQANAEIEEKWLLLEQELENVDDTKLDEAKTKLKLFQMSHFSPESQISYATRCKLLKKIEEHKANLKALTGKYQRASIERELEECLKNSPGNFVVHCLRHRAGNDSLATAMKICSDRPALLFCKHEDVISAQCSVPEEFTTQKFTAINWLTTAMIEFGWVGNYNVDQNPKFNCSMLEKQLTDAQLQVALSNGIQFAQKNIG